MILTTSDEKLVARTLAGDRGAFQTLVERHYVSVYRTCRSVLHNAQDAEDATQEVFLRAYKALGQFAGRGAFGGWLLRLTVNHCINRSQSAAAQASARSLPIELFADTLPASRETDPAANFWRAEERERIRMEMSELPPHQRAALGMRVIDGLSYDEIAEAMGVPVNSVRSWLHRGRARLRAALKEVVEC